MDKPKNIWMAMRGLAAISLTGIGMVVLSTVGGLTGFVLALALLYLAFFASASQHRPGG
jgi:hypothetical protein